MQTIHLQASNGKETQTKTETISIEENTNLRIIEEVIFGVNTSHIRGDFGAFYSLEERFIYNQETFESEIDEGNTPQIDLVFFGLNNTFSTNLFVSPDNLEGTTFSHITNVNTTKFINSQELCVCNTSLNEAQFDAMNDDTLLQALVIEETLGGSQDFDDSVLPRIVLFETEEGIKGAIKIVDFVENGDESYIRASLKYQKEPR